jgi:hypothetical protein
VAPDGAVRRLLAARCRRQCILGRRPITQRLLVGDKVVGQLRGI